jgi:hypothetical protein
VAICQYVPTKPDPLPCARQTNDSNRSEASSSGARAVASHAHLPGEWLVETPDGAMPSVRPQSRQPAYSAGLWSQKFGLPSIAFFVCTGGLPGRIEGAELRTASIRVLVSIEML